MGMGTEMLLEQLIDSEIGARILAEQYAEDCTLAHKGIWRMRNGTLIKISNMSSQHHRNTISMIDRRKDQLDDQYLDLLLEAKQKMEDELLKRYPLVDPAFARG